MSHDLVIRSPRRVRIGAFVAVGLLHALAIVMLIRAFAPDFAAQAVSRAVATFAVTAPPPPPAPSPRPAGQQGVAGRKAVPRAVAAPRPRVKLPDRSPAPPVAANGSADSAGAQAAGPGTGAGDAGAGTGSGGAGTGQGGGSATRPVKLAGDINSARDYQRESRDLRVGDYAIIWLTVGTDGRPADCKVVRASRDPAAGPITCRLALARFRFRPATDAAGQPVVATYAWRQTWFMRE